MEITKTEYEQYKKTLDSIEALHGYVSTWNNAYPWEIAEEVETLVRKLQAERDRLREALEKINYDYCDHLDDAMMIAQQALKDEK